MPGEDDVSVEPVGFLDVFTAALDTAAATEARLMGGAYRNKMSPVAARYGTLVPVTCSNGDVTTRDNRSLFVSNGSEVSAGNKLQQGIAYIGKGGKLYSREVVFGTSLTYLNGVFRVDNIPVPVAPTGPDGYVIGLGMTEVDDAELAAYVGSRMAFLHKGTLTSTL